MIIEPARGSVEVDAGSEAPAPRAGSRAQDPATADGIATRLGPAVDEPDRWPLPMRAAIAIGGAAGLWALIALALR